LPWQESYLYGSPEESSIEFRREVFLYGYREMYEYVPGIGSSYARVLRGLDFLRERATLLYGE
jgi:hypothetical protein